LFFWFTFHQQIKNKIVSFVISWRLSFPNLHTKTPKIPHKTKKSPLQAQKPICSNQAKQSKATRTTRTWKLWTWPKYHTQTHTHTHIKNSTPKCFCFCVWQKESKLEVGSSEQAFAYMGKTNPINPSCKNPNTL
jgi:hypothetical protein